jgi:hypothetical protein
MQSVVPSEAFAIERNQARRMEQGNSDFRWSLTPEARENLHPGPSQQEADTCTSGLEACTRTFGEGVGIRMSELEAGTSTSGEEAGIRMSEAGADRRVSQVEADRRILSEAVDSTLRGVGVLNVARRCSISAARRRCKQPAASGRRSMTSLVMRIGGRERRINVT